MHTSESIIMTADEKLPWPLNCNESLIGLIAEITGEPEATVTHRLLQEERCLGWNVREDLQTQQLIPHQWHEDLVRFYSETNAFLYETAVWNRRPLKKQLRQWILDYIEKNIPEPCRILSYGDGLGFDSLFWSQTKHDVTYFEVSTDCITFAQQVFTRNGADVRQITTEPELSKQPFDLIICLDVLEHVPVPPELLAKFNQWLNPAGLLISHAPFFLIHPYYATHLMSNRKWSGSLDLYRDQGFQPIDSRFFWDPIVLQKTEAGQQKVRPPLRTRLGAHLLRYGHGPLGFIHCQVARYLSSGEAGWTTDLQNRIDGDQISP